MKINGVYFDESSLEQLDIWADAVGLGLESLVRILMASKEFKVEGGCIVSLCLDLGLLEFYRAEIEWCGELTSLKTLIIKADDQCLPDFTGNLESLEKLVIEDICTTHLTLEAFPNLLELTCFAGDLSGGGEGIDLHYNPKLEKLTCNHSNLESLDLSHTPNLLYIDCSHNPISKLDLKLVPKLIELKCFATGIKGLAYYIPA